MCYMAARYFGLCSRLREKSIIHAIVESSYLNYDSIYSYSLQSSKPSIRSVIGIRYSLGGFIIKKGITKVVVYYSNH